MRISLLAAIAVLLLAAGASMGADRHVVKPSTWAEAPTVPDAMRQRVEDAAVEFQQLAPVPRLALYDIAYPASDAELTDMAGYGVLLLTTLSQDSTELPPKQLFVDIGGIQHRLKLITATKTTANPSPTVARVLGPYRWDGLYLFPVYLTRDTAALSIDFAAHRTGFILGRFSSADQNNFHYSALVTNPPLVADPPPEALKSLIAREFPGFLARDL